MRGLCGSWQVATVIAKGEKIMSKRMFTGLLGAKSRVAFSLIILLAFICAGNLAGQIVPPPTSQGRPAEETDIYIVTFRQGTPASERAAAAQQAGAVLRVNYNITNAVSVQVPNATVLTRLRNDPRVLAVFANHFISLHASQLQAQAKGGNSGGGGGTGGGGGSKGGGKPQKTPTITDFTPTSGLVGTSVQINGTFFTGATAVAFHGLSASFTVVSDTSITAAVPAGATTGPITVTTPGGTATSATDFTVMVASTPPAAPSNLTLQVVSYRQIDLTWQDNSNNEGGFWIERCTGSGCTNFFQIAQAGSNVTGYSNAGLTAETTYTYRIRAFNSAGNSGYSNAAEGTTPSAPPSSQVVPSGVERIGAAPGVLHWTGAGVGVAVVDTGIDFNHPDLGMNPEQVGINSFNSFGGSCQDIYGHGTHVAGIVAARDNTIDVVGVAPDATVYCVNVFQPDPIYDVSATDESLIAGLEWVATNANLVTPRIRVVNMSLGRPKTPDDTPSHPLHVIVKALYDSGISVVVSAGNDPQTEVSQQIPASYPEVMAIASTTAVDGVNGYDSLFGPCTGEQNIRADTASYFTTDGAFVGGTGVTVSAPGEEREDIYDYLGACNLEPIGILSTWPGGETIELYGTSMSAPHVAGVVALMWQKELSLGLSLAPEVVRSRIRNNVDRLGTAPLDSPLVEYSFDGQKEGVVWAPAALGDAPPPPQDFPPAVSISSPAGNSTFNSGASIHFVGTAPDPEEGNLAASLVWTSSRDGQIGTGGDFWKTLSNGVHTITASVTDLGGNIGSASVSITVGSSTQPTTVSVSSITYGLQGSTLIITVRVVNEFGGAVAGATVSILLMEWLYTGQIWTANGTTNTQGIVQFQLSNAPNGGYTTQIKNVVANGLTWDGYTPDNWFLK